jgi:DNA primase large subunit
MLGEVLNPFSKDALRVVAEAPPLPELPSSVYELALKKISFHPSGESMSPGDPKKDILSFHLLFAACATRFAPASQEAKLVIEVTKKIIRGRIGGILKEAHRAGGYDEDTISRAFYQFFPVNRVEELRAGKMLMRDLRLASRSIDPEDALRYWVPVRSILPIIEGCKTKLTDLYISEGRAFLSLRNLVVMATAVLDVSLKKHMEKVFQRREKIKELEPIAEAVERAASEPEYLDSYHRRIYSFLRTGKGGGSPLKPQFFPPCIQHTLRGVSSGSRNYAITVLLTSFISYARIAPTGSAKDAKLSDYLKDEKVLAEEVLPIIFEAAESCSPPLFADQPLERMNIYYHLGLGMTEEVSLDHAGRSSWYFPPNCDKIRREAPSVCRPDKECKGIKNPLSYYARKVFTRKKNAKKSRAE